MNLSDHGTDLATVIVGTMTGTATGTATETVTGTAIDTGTATAIAIVIGLEAVRTTDGRDTMKMMPMMTLAPREDTEQVPLGPLQDVPIPVLRRQYTGGYSQLISPFSDLMSPASDYG